MRTRVVFGINDFLVGGAQRLIAQLVDQIDRERFECHVVVLFAFDKPTLFHEIPPDITVHRLAFTGFLDIGSWVRLYRLMRSLRADVVISNLFFSNTVFRVLKPFCRYRVVACEHNTYVRKPRWEQLMDRILFKVTDRMLAVSTTVADFTAKQEKMPRSAFTVILNGIDVLAAQESLANLPSADELKQQQGLSPETRVMLNVSRLTPQKNHALLVRSFAQFVRKHPEWKLVLVGDGQEQPRLMDSARELGIQDAVHFAGNQMDVWPFYKLADMFVSTSHIEGLSIAYLEALAAGLPLVATRTAGTDEILKEGDNGYFIPRADEESAITAFEKGIGLATPERKAAISTAAREYDIREVARKYEILIEEVRR